MDQDFLQQALVEHSLSLQQLISGAHLPSFMQAVSLHLLLSQQDAAAVAPARSYLQQSCRLL
jgi:hypothetical protein